MQAIYLYLYKKVLPVLFYFFFITGQAQINENASVTFNFDEQQIKEKDNKLKPKPVGISLTYDRFGNPQSAIYLHGHSDSYLNLGTSALLKPKTGTISIWVNLDRKIFAGKGFKSNPILLTKNGPQDDFYCSYGFYLDLTNDRLGVISAKDSTLDVNIMSEDSVVFNKWYHLVYTISNSEVVFYINGKLQQKAPKRFEIVYWPADSVIVGNGANKKNNRWAQGIFDDIQIFHRVLSDKEIMDLYNAPNPKRFSGLFNEILKYSVFLLIVIVIILFLVRRNKINLKKQREKLELVNKVSELELKVVKAQMNPHFISNCLAAIQELIYSGHIEKAGLYIAKFSYFLRQVLDCSDKNNITISEELEIMRLNIELEQLRFKNKFDFQIQVQADIDPSEFMIPALITQPFIENAIWHGLLALPHNQLALLIIRVLQKNEFVVIEIEDNGVGITEKSNSNKNSRGIKLINDKIENLNKLANTTNYQLKIINLHNADGQPSGTKVQIQLDHIKE